MGKHIWRQQEDYFCARRIIDEYVIKNNEKDTSTFITELKQSEILNSLSTGSIKMKIQNIKYILSILNVSNRITLKPLENASEQSIKSVIKVLEELDISYSKYRTEKL